MMNNLPRILFIDENSNDRELAFRVLAGEFGELDIESVGTATDFSRSLAARRFGLVITEVQFSWSDGLELVKLVREVRPDCPVILFTSSEGEELWSETLRLGVDGFVSKSTGGFVRLPAAVRSALFRARRRALASSSDAPYRRLVEGLPVGVFVAALDGEILEANAAFAAMLGFADPEEVARSSFSGFFAQTSMAASWRSQMESSRAVGNLDARLRRADGMLMWARISSWVVEEAATGGRHIQGTVEDTGDYHAAQDELAKRTRALARSNDELEQFAYVVTHDLQQPLGMVSSYLEMLGESGSDSLDDEARSYLNRAAAGAAKMQRLVDAVLGYARVDARGAEFVAVDLGRVLEDVETTLNEQIEATGALVSCGGLPTVVADPGQMDQLLQNLIANAVKFAGDEPPRIHLSCEERESEWQISVRDHGIGLDPESADRVFVMFQRLHTEEEYPGTGIGLAICKRIVERHGGRIWVEAAPGRGATFRFTLPKLTVADEEPGNG
ncbi:MAG: ATP-binding protein [Thermoanaerobaculales bacterium]